MVPQRNSVEAAFTFRLQACWEETYYNKQKKLMVHYLLLQSQGQVPPHVTTEHMSDWLVSQGKKSLRERLWKETLEEGNDLARLAAAFESVRSILERISQSFSTDDLQSPFYMRSVCAFVADEVQSCFQPPAATLPVPPVLAVAVSTTLPADIQAVELIRIVVVTFIAEADAASSHLEVVDITPNTEADQDSSHLKVVDITPNTEEDQASSHLEVVDITPNTEADQASSHLEVVDITLNTDADPASSHLEVVDITANTEADPASSHLEVADIGPKTEADPANSHLEVQDITPNTEADTEYSHLNVVDITPNREADPASSHLNVVDITLNTEAEPISSLLEVVDVTPEERTLTMAVVATLPADIQAEDVAVVIPDVTPHVTKDVTLDVPCRARKGAVRQFFFQVLEGSVLLRLPQGRGGTILIIHQTFRNGIEP
ncbi:uncharacterized protein LOC115180195 [Salmo trutta]|uniref:uncharacterized protein LOC115180195 n=1 Tax=Salmo trutta TaxID=8032 RepID=UPI001130A769|nr:uncharacterized protein LOC115180195 [Salmo trutta]